MNYLILHEIFHLLIALVIGGILYSFFKNKKLIFLAVFISIGIDIDHLVDFFHFFGTNVQNPITGPDYFCLSGRLFIPLHGWEYTILLFMLSLYFPKIKIILLSVVMALTAHYLLDQLTNAMHPLGYSLIFRFINNFDIHSVSYGCIL